jgi:hypothetical protein
MIRRFLYFLPGVPGCNPAMLRDRGLLGRFRKFGGGMLEHSISECLKGPGGGSGCIVTAGPGGAEYLPERQRWLEGEKFWVGIEDASFPPRPQDLEREAGIDGYELELLDNNVWRVPLVHAWDEKRAQHRPNLPQVMAPVIESGNTRMQIRVQAEFEAVHELAGRIFQAFAGQATVSLETLFSDAAAILGVNYRIGPEEIGLLGLLNESLAARVLALSIDLPRIEAQAQALAGQGLVVTEPEN